jgi:hypothetical protein
MWFRTPVPEGALFYGERRRRSVVGFNETLRALTRNVAAQTAEMIAAAPMWEKHRCGACSLELCRPKSLERPCGVAADAVTQHLGLFDVPGPPVSKVSQIGHTFRTRHLEP